VVAVPGPASRVNREYSAFPARSLPARRMRPRMTLRLIGAIRRAKHFTGRGHHEPTSRANPTAQASRRSRALAAEFSRSALRRRSADRQCSAPTLAAPVIPLASNPRCASGAQSRGLFGGRDAPDRTWSGRSACGYQVDRIDIHAGDRRPCGGVRADRDRAQHRQQRRRCEQPGTIPHRRCVGRARVYRTAQAPLSAQVAAAIAPVALGIAALG